MGIVMPGRPGGGSWRAARGQGVTRWEYTDGTEMVWTDKRGRVTRHFLARANRPGFDVCFKYVRTGEGRRWRRVVISHDEWERLRQPRPHRGGYGDPAKTRGREDRRSAAGFTEDWYRSLSELRVPHDSEVPPLDGAPDETRED